MFEINFFSNFYSCLNFCKLRNFLNIISHFFNIFDNTHPCEKKNSFLILTKCGIFIEYAKLRNKYFVKLRNKYFSTC